MMKKLSAAFLLLFATQVFAFDLPVQADSSEKLAAPKTSFSTDTSDLWWNPNENGWGLTMGQQADFAFVTMFFYGTDSKPTWATAQLNAGSSGTFTGPLYLTTGPWYGGIYNSAAFGYRIAGTFTFQYVSVNTATISYTIDGISVTKAIQRQLLRYDNYNGSYVVTVNLTQTGCAGGGDGTVTGAMGMTVNQNGTAMSMQWVLGSSGDTCSYGGTYSQAGKMGRFNGTYSCSTGEIGNMTLFEMTNRVGMMSGRLTGGSTNIGCQYTGRFTGLNPNVP